MTSKECEVKCPLKTNFAKWVYRTGIVITISFLCWGFFEYRDFYTFKHVSGKEIAEQKVILKEIKDSVDQIKIQTARIDQKINDKEEILVAINKELKSDKTFKK